MKSKDRDLELALRWNKENPIGAVFRSPNNRDKRIGFNGIGSSEETEKNTADLLVVESGKIIIQEVELPKRRG